MLKFKFLIPEMWIVKEVKKYLIEKYQSNI